MPVYEAAAYAATLTSSDFQVESELPSSGRPLWPGDMSACTWGSWSETQLRTAEHPMGKVALFGQCWADDAAIQQRLGVALASGDDSALTSLPGSYVALVRRPEALTVTADPSGQSPTYYNGDQSPTVVASQPGLAYPGSPSLDERYIAAHLIMPGIGGYLLGDRTAFKGVKSLVGGQTLRLSVSSNDVSTVPSFGNEHSSSLEEAADRLRMALTAAVSARLTSGQPFSSDMSGGIDSSSLAFLARSRLGDNDSLPVFFSSQDTIDSGDARYARQYIARGGDKFKPYYYDERKTSPGFSYEDFLDIDRPEDLAVAATLNPHGWRFATSYLQYIATSGSRLHMTGDGGDEVVAVGNSYLASIAGLATIGRFLREGAAIARIQNQSPLVVWRAAARLSRLNVTSSLDQLAYGLETAVTTDDWHVVNKGQLWKVNAASAHLLTDFGRQRVAGLLREPGALLNGANELSVSELIAQNSVRIAGNYAALMRHCAAVSGSGLELQMPFMDRDVLQAAFSVPICEKGDPYQTKLLLARALKSVVPPEVLARRSKGSYSEAAMAAYGKSAPALRQIFSESRLIQMGLVDANAVQRLLSHVDTLTMNSLWGLDRLVAVEGWLRSAEKRQPLVTNTASNGRERIKVADRVVRSLAEMDLPRYVKVPDYVHAVASDTGQLVMFNRRSGLYHPLDAARSELTRALAGGGSMQAAVYRLRSVYPEADPGVLQRDISVHMTDLLKYGLLCSVSAAEQHQLPRTVGNYLLEAVESVVAHAPNNGKARVGERLITAGTFAVGKALDRWSPQSKLPMLRWLHKNWTTQPASYDQASRLLEAAYTTPHIGRVACAEASFAAALAAAVARREVVWHQGASFRPLTFHAWLEAESRPVRAPAEGQVAGRFQSFFTP